MVGLAAFQGRSLPVLAAHSGDPADEAVVRPSRPLEPFGLRMVPYDRQQAMADKVRILEEIPRVTQHWNGIARRFHGLDRFDQMKAVNVFVNKVPYVTDADLSGHPDFWADPLHFFGRGGDCEEFALAKYGLLLRLGFHPRRMMVLAMERDSDGQGHAVLGVALGGGLFILDQLRDDLVTDAHYEGYTLIFSLSSLGILVPA